MKNQLIEKITTEIGKIGKVPKNVIKYGSIVSLLLFIGAGIVFAYNNYFLGDYTLMCNMILLMKSSMTIFAEFIIGGLIIDHLSKSFN